MTNEIVRTLREYHRRTEQDRFYCPDCGCVWGGWFSIIAGGWIMMPHTRYISDTRYTYRYEMCEGGKVDPEADRAP